MARVQKAGGGAVTPGRAPTGPAKKSTTGHAGATGAAGARGIATTRSHPAPVAAAPSAAAAKGPAKVAPTAAAATPKAAAKGTLKGAPAPAKAVAPTASVAKVAAKPVPKTSPKAPAASPAAAAGAAKTAPKAPAPAVKAAPKPSAKAAPAAKATPPVKAAPAVKAAPSPAAKAPARKEVPRRSGPLDKFLVEQRQLLLEERTTHVRQAESLKEEADALAAEMEPGESEFGEEGGEGGNLSVERELDLVLSAQAKASVDEIDRALLKIDAGSYGLCEKCGKEIPKLRLKALPHAPLCVACKSGGLSRR